MNTRNIQLPLIITNEKEEMLGSILQMLRSEGFAIVPVQEAQLSSTEFASDSVKYMDALSILRYIRATASKNQPVRIASAAATSAFTQRAIAA